MSVAKFTPIDALRAIVQRLDAGDRIRTMTAAQRRRLRPVRAIALEAIAAAELQVVDLDLNAVPDEDLTREYMRRHNLRRDTSKLTGRAKVLRPCPICSEKFGAREMQGHIPECRRAQRLARSL